MAVSHFAGRVSSSRAMSNHKTTSTRMQQKIDQNKDDPVAKFKKVLVILPHITMLIASIRLISHGT